VSKLGATIIRQGPCFVDVKWESKEKMVEQQANIADLGYLAPLLKGAKLEPLPSRGESRCARCGRQEHGDCSVGLSYQERICLREKTERNRLRALEKLRRKRMAEEDEEKKRRQIQASLQDAAKKLSLELWLKWMVEVHLQGFKMWKEQGLCFGFARQGQCSCGDMCNHKKLGFPSSIPYASNCVYPQAHDLRGNLRIPCFEFCDNGSCSKGEHCSFAHVPGAKYLGRLIRVRHGRQLRY
jgi:hypothetical protein